ncbi:MAG: 4-hydroxythreonine-4-phosphate dehydrogenase PdxA [Flavobacteriaceae bacterium]|nr:4-hydroxythreonine-4-phosphate dehydrogenase PdxA [Bacteroidia bacterium]NNK87208.1 4-hydroxythreonine-4-phosphate dehydrogenase PdxA [Flavobacteriaceae bacterium]
MQKKEKLVVGISVGDLNGIGGELIIKTFEDQRFLDFCTPIIFASSKYLSFMKKHFESDLRFNVIHKLQDKVHGKLNVFNVWKEPVKIEFGLENSESGKYALRSFKSATRALKEKAVDVLVTAPIHKHNIQSEQFKFPGHTDYLDQELEGQSLMFMVTDELKVGLVTDHIPVKDIAEHITEDLLREKVEIIHSSLMMDFGIRKPKIAVLGINPHTGDNGVIGQEDDEVLKPALKAIRDEGKLVFGPYSADSFFGSDTFKNFDAVLAMYHDQGLIPFKTLSFGRGVNFTAGLNRIRTSPDHGTAFEIAGKGKADNNSFMEAIFTAIKIFRNREMYLELTKDPLKKKA